jgi:hypothetical protein
MNGRQMSPQVHANPTPSMSVSKIEAKVQQQAKTSTLFLSGRHTEKNKPR